MERALQRMTNHELSRPNKQMYECKIHESFQTTANNTHIIGTLKGVYPTHMKGSEHCSEHVTTLLQLGRKSNDCHNNKTKTKE